MKSRSALFIDGTTIYGSPAQTVNSYVAVQRALQSLGDRERIVFAVPGVAADGKRTVTGVLLHRLSAASFIVVEGEPGAEEALSALDAVSEDFFNRFGSAGEEAR